MFQFGSVRKEGKTVQIRKEGGIWLKGQRLSDTHLYRERSVVNGTISERQNLPELAPKFITRSSAAKP